VATILSGLLGLAPAASDGLELGSRKSDFCHFSLGLKDEAMSLNYIFRPYLPNVDSQ
jgi:hypothetical protein